MKKIDKIFPYFYDILVILVVSHNVLVCYKKGFVKSLMSIISYFSGFLIAHFLGKYFLRNLFESEAFCEIEDSLFKSIKIPENFGKLAFGFRGSEEVSGGTFGSNILKILISRVMFVILFFCFCSCFRFVKRYILKYTKIAKRVPVIGFLDGVLGAFCGILKALVFLFIFAIICFIFIVLTKDELPFLNMNVINSTYLFFLFYKITYFLK